MVGKLPADQTDRTGIYLVANVPIIGGRLYSVQGFLKSQDVKAASLGDMSPTGATIILEWADKDRKWLASGDYAKGLYGTTDWQPVTTKLMRAPKDAGFAVIFLAMRATGTGWFDDLTMTEVVRNVVLLEPLFGKQVADNTPSFNWQHGEPGPGTLELSTDETFQAAKTTRYEDLTPPFSPDQPLAPGKWYWRVSIPEHGSTSVVWNFAQTAPLTQDCNAPKISPDHANLTTVRQPVTVRLSDNVAVTKVALTLDGKPSAGQVSATSVKLTPRADWTPGLHKLEVTASDAAGNSAHRVVFLNYAPNVTRKQWLANGGIAIGGKPQYLLGMYGVRTEDLPEMAQAGYDFVHNYTWDGPGTNDSAIEYLDACQKLGLQAFIGFDRAKLLAWDEEFVAERVGALSRHPALLAWYLFDEPDLPHQYVPPDQLRALYQLIHTLDPMHPVIVTVAQTNFMPRYYDSYDVYWSMDYGTPAANVENFDGHRAALKPGTPIMSIVHSYDGKQQGPSKGGDVEKFQP
ncbi:MAG: Ig-like domain-containing protein, partial [Armatimonadota bacterium]